MKAYSEYLAPETVREAVRILEEKGAKARILAGGTDVMVRIRRGMAGAGETTLVSVHRVQGLGGMRADGDDVVIGAATTASELTRDPVIRERVPILGYVADRLASAQIRNVATIGGNLANASPAGDLINPLLLLDAVLVLVSSGGERRVPVAEFFTGPGASVRRPNELLTEIRVPVPPAGRVFRFRKAGTRPAMECSVITVGVAFTPEGGAIRDVRVACGSAAPTPLRCGKTEAVLEGAKLDEGTIERAAETAAAEVSPISDVRGSEGYRRALVAEFLRRLLHDDQD